MSKDQKAHLICGDAKPVGRLARATYPCLSPCAIAAVARSGAAVERPFHSSLTQGARREGAPFAGFRYLVCDPDEKADHAYEDDDEKKSSSPTRKAFGGWSLKIFTGDDRLPQIRVDSNTSSLAAPTKAA